MTRFIYICLLLVIATTVSAQDQFKQFFKNDKIGSVWGAFTNTSVAPEDIIPATEFYNMYDKGFMARVRNDFYYFDAKATLIWQKNIDSLGNKIQPNRLLFCYDDNNIYFITSIQGRRL